VALRVRERGFAGLEVDFAGFEGIRRSSFYVDETTEDVRRAGRAPPEVLKGTLKCCWQPRAYRGLLIGRAYILTRRQRPPAEHLNASSKTRFSTGLDGGIAGGKEERSCDLEAVPMLFGGEAPIGLGITQGTLDRLGRSTVNRGFLPEIAAGDRACR
jgi:hypothetical protein